MSMTSALNQSCSGNLTNWCGSILFTNGLPLVNYGKMSPFVNKSIFLPESPKVEHSNGRNFMNGWVSPLVTNGIPLLTRDKTSILLKFLYCAIGNWWSNSSIGKSLISRTKRSSNRYLTNGWILSVVTIWIPMVNFSMDKNPTVYWLYQWLETS